MGGHFRCIHSVAITRRTNRQLLLPGLEQPSGKRLHSFYTRNGMAFVADRKKVDNAVCVSRQWHIEPKLLLTWLNASKFIKQQNQNVECALSFKDVWNFNRHEDDHLHEDQLLKISGETLRRARVRLDAVSLSLCRREAERARTASGADVRVDAVRFLLYCTAILIDAPTQWTCQELFPSFF